ncbi:MULTISPECIES: diaminobutyrate acetyltransferase [Microbulbifer]|uniref:diaminobutyrate acetyltransferase n=1 Tax=Microbulbifer TaxID=48073 RepID=UPI001E2DAB09|nr:MULTISPECIES: diaminobutyrate acetyltransferase [Microbulbifer]UHQ56865.1 diaminobutyrate acetyltransferase [Microbulbifer sp. YPW16]
MTPGEEESSIHFRHPTVADGAAIWQLVVDAGTLDRNSSYLYLLLCRDFPDCCVVAERGTSLLGFTTGYRAAARPDTWFLWQVGVAAEARGQGLAKRMVTFALGALVPGEVRYLETTVSPSNTASRALFKSIARQFETRLEESPLFDASLFPGSEGEHESEPLLRLGPFDPGALKQAGHTLI